MKYNRWLLLAIFLAESHQPRHLVLGQPGYLRLPDAGRSRRRPGLDDLPDPPHAAFFARSSIEDDMKRLNVQGLRFQVFLYPTLNFEL